jgi:ABC-type phosphate transport system auxiliary subunit
MEAQRKSHENRYRQIINEKKQLDKNSKAFLEEKQILEEENQRLKTILQTIKGSKIFFISYYFFCILKYLDTLENVDDIHSIVDTILKIRQDYFILKQHHEQIKIENEKLLLNIHQQKNIIDEYIQTKIELEKRLINNEQELNNFKKEIEENINRYEHLHNEFQLYKENHQMKTSNKSLYK